MAEQYATLLSKARIVVRGLILLKTSIGFLKIGSIADGNLILWYKQCCIIWQCAYHYCQCDKGIDYCYIGFCLICQIKLQRICLKTPELTSLSNQEILLSIIVESRIVSSLVSILYHRSSFLDLIISYISISCNIK